MQSDECLMEKVRSAGCGTCPGMKQRVPSGNQYSAFIILHSSFPISLSGRERRLRRRPGAQSKAPPRSTCRSGRPSYRSFRQVVAPTQGGKGSVGFPQIRRKRWSPRLVCHRPGCTHAAASRTGSCFLSLPSAINHEMLFGWSDSVRAAYALRRRGYLSRASTTRSMAIMREPFTRTTSPGRIT